MGFLGLKWEPLASGGRRYTEWELLELSWVAVPSNASAVLAARVGGKRAPEPLFYVPASKTFLVEPAMIAEAMRKAVREVTRKMVCAAAGRLGTDDEDVTAVLTNMKRHRGASSIAGLAKAMGGPIQEPDVHGLAPDPFELMAWERKHAPGPLPPALEIPDRILRKVARA